MARWLLLSAVAALIAVSAVSGVLETTFVHCCSIGSTLAAEKLQCDKYTAPVSGVSVEQQSMCLSAIEICCLQVYRDLKCMDGKRAAKQGADCVASNSPGGEYEKDCCEACKIGLITASMNMGCAFHKFSFGCPWDEVHRECCLESTPSVPIPDQNNTITSAIPAGDNNAVLGNLCDILRGELCAHICVSIPGSYKCECHEGFVLMSDDKSCQQKDFPDRCTTNNPCTHKCLDTGIAVECSCEPGYQLGVDERSCFDIDECILKMDLCDPMTQHCKNEPGSYTCVNADGKAVKPTATQNIDLSGSANAIDFGKCPAGYQYSPQSQVCDDIDECSLKLSRCSKDYECQNTIGSFVCVQKTVENCLPGYRKDLVTDSCVDLDECAAGLHNCSVAESCTNTEGSFLCNPICGSGYRIHPANHSKCVDIDECAEMTDNCNRRNETCTNTIGSFICQNQPECPAGYRKTANECRDIDECIENIHVCDLAVEMCVNEPGGYRCEVKRHVASPGHNESPACDIGFKFNSRHTRCVDIDECSEGDESPCSSNEVCENTIGSYLCKCMSGFQLDPFVRACVDVNECQTNRHSCLPSQRCDNTIGSFQCIRFTSCGTGYTLNAETGKCEDDDECTLKTDNCRFLGPSWVCRNTLGSFRCERKHCNSKQILMSSGECKSIDCPLGFTTGQLGKCIDIDECSTGKVCHQNQQCINTPGSFQCINFFKCGAGYKLNDNGNQCLDIDECAEGQNECGENQICQNQPGGYVCQCPKGYTIHNTDQCLDIDECEKYRGQICGISAQCQNTPGSYECLCKSGFRQEQGTKQCADIDECAERPGLCHHKCFNTWGSYRCSCNSGFILQSDNRTCLDIDECEKFKDRNLCIGMCVNTAGSYTCSCPEGYRLGFDGRTCQDIDECATGTVCNQRNEVCVNTRGSFRCNTINCPPDYIRDTEHKNRCKRVTTVCQSNDNSCMQVPSSYSYSFITFVSNVAIPSSGQLELFTMRGPLRSTTTARFTLQLSSARAPAGIPQATREHFWLRQTSHNQATISLVRSIRGPQELELQLSMELYHNGLIGGKAVAKLIIYVSEYEY